MRSKFSLNAWPKVFFEEKFPELWTYILRSKNDFIKIGKTSSPNTRFMHLDNLVPLDLIPVLLVDHRLVPEASLHGIFCSQRYKGEWFYINDDLKNLCTNPEIFLEKYVIQ